MTHLEALDQSIKAFNEGNWDEYKSSFTEDCHYTEYATGRSLNSSDELLSNSKSWKNAFPDAHGEVINRIDNGDYVVEEVVWSGTHTGELHTPDGQTIPPTSKNMKVNAVMINKFKDDKICETNHYFDMLTMLKQLGLS
ncbi:MAG: hypothetical protein CMP11_08830 [Zetaproteobacteria bacterium]|nr:hypothetical protein [Pseudobdellovibrionaceae bacterium]|tara:strand:+ start:53 stop:469 length:417 start_codon:yes stop_codon:yes gene_type:complete